MPIVAEHHRWKDAGHTPRDDWPEDCLVQWGSAGVVLSADGGARETAFFEAFPGQGGFIRGEGGSIPEAEDRALAQYRAKTACEHAWSRRRYTNGGAICRKCGGFATVFQPVHMLGDAFRPLEATALDMLADGMARPCPEDPRQHRWRRKIWLKARRMGIALPDFASAPPEPDRFDQDGYMEASRRAVVAWLLDNEEALEGEEGGLQGLFSGLHRASLKRMLAEAREEVACSNT